MGIEQYWMGKDLDLEGLWEDFDSGSGYIAKVSSSELHLLRLMFNGHPAHLPLFDHEVIYKTVKGTFHDVKAECFTPEAYNNAAPIFLHRVDRGSGIFEFLAQFDPLMTWIVALGGAATWYRATLAKDQEFDEKRLKFIRDNFPGVSDADTQAYLKAWTTFQRRRVLHRLIGQGLHRVQVSREPIKQETVKLPPKMVDLDDVVGVRQSTGDA